eukprot:6033290-Pleurochrysis_carterae.AAC.1
MCAEVDIYNHPSIQRAASELREHANSSNVRDLPSARARCFGTDVCVRCGENLPSQRLLAAFARLGLAAPHARARSHARTCTHAQTRLHAHARAQWRTHTQACDHAHADACAHALLYAHQRFTLSPAWPITCTVTLASVSFACFPSGISNLQTLCPRLKGQ